jgi:hypothetical protein
MSEYKELIDTLMNKINTLIEDNEKQRKSIEQLINMNNKLTSTVADEKQPMQPKDYIPLFHKASFSKKIVEDKNHIQCFELIYKMDDELFEALCIAIVNILGLMIKIDRNACVIWEPSNHGWKSAPHDYRFNWNLIDTYIYKSKYFVSINCGKSAYDKLIEYGFFDQTVSD